MRKDGLSLGHTFENPNVSETLSKPAVLPEESLQVVAVIITSIKKRGQLHESKPKHRGVKNIQDRFRKKKKDTALKTARRMEEKESEYHLHGNQQPLDKC